MNPLFLTIKTDGTIWLSLNKADAIALQVSPAFRVELTPSIHPTGAVKIGSITGNSPTYGVTDAMAGEFGNKHARSY